jgi:hypothetical protein
MFQKNEIWVGLVVGLLLPAMGFVILYEIFNLLEHRGVASSAGFSPYFRERTVGIVAIVLNVIPLNIYQKRRWDLAMRGIVIATSLLAIAWVIVFGLKLL